MLERIANRICQSQVARHLFFLAVTSLTILFMGYQFGTFDQTVHIPFLKANADPTLFPNDPFVALRHEHYSYFWFLLLPFYRLGVLEITMFITHIIVTYFTFWMIYELAETLFKNPLSAMFGTIAFIFPHVSFSGFPLIEYSLLNRTFVMPFLILTINLYLRGIRARSFFMLGILYNLHVLSVNYVLALFMFDFVLEYRKIGWKKILNCLVVFILAALPVLLWKMQDTSGTEIQLEPVFLNTITRSMMLHVFYLAGNFYVLPASISALSAYILFLVAYRNSPPRPHDKTVMIFVLATALVVLVEGIVVGWLPISILIQLQIIRTGLFAVLFGYLYFADYMARKWTAEPCDRTANAIVLGTFVVSTFTFVTLIVLAIKKWWSATPARVKAMAVFMPLVFAGTLAYALSANFWKPGIYIDGFHDTWQDVQEWAKANTPKDAIFITPLNKWWLYQGDWRVFSERQSVVALSDILEASFEPEYMSIWEPRMEALAPGSIAKFKGDLLENQRIVGEAYNNLPTLNLLKAACDYHASYVVAEKPYPRELPLVYENADYLVYDVRGSVCK
jgi:hypothetical protein